MHAVVLLSTRGKLAMERLSLAPAIQLAGKRSISLSTRGTRRVDLVHGTIGDAHRFGNRCGIMCQQVALVTERGEIVVHRFFLLRPDEQDKLMAAALERLSSMKPKLAQAFILVVYHGLSVSDAALVLGVWKGTISKRVQRAERMLKGMIESQMISEVTETSDLAETG